MNSNILKQIVMMSKYAVFGIIIQCFCFSLLIAEKGSAQTKSVEQIYLTLHIEHNDIEEVFKQISDETDFDFIYSNNLLEKKKKINLNADHMSLGDILRRISQKTGLQFKRVDQDIIVSQRSPRSEKVVEVYSLHAERQVAGKVIDESGEGLPGVNVILKGTSIGTVTDINGDYSLEVPDEGAVLIFSSVGYIQEEIMVGNQSVIDVSMVPDITSLEEIVIVGYGQKTRKTNAGAVEQITGEILQERPITNVSSGLQGAMPGLTVTRSSGQPGNEDYNLNIRGVSSVNGSGNSPLVLVDGVEGDINLLNPNDIATISVLKDASAAIYGARAAGGVILITTKNGKKDQPLKVSYTGNYAISKISNELDRVTLKEWIEMDWEAKINAGVTPQFQNASLGNNTIEDVFAKIDAGAPPDRLGTSNDYLFYEDPNWNDRIFDNGVQHTHNLNFAGGSQSTNYNLSFGYLDTEGLFSNAYDNSKRFNTRLNLGFDISDKIKLDTRLSYINQQDESPAYSAENVLDALNKIFTWFPERTESSQYLTQWGFTNPRQMLDKEVGKAKEKTEVIRGNFVASWEIIKGLNLYGQAAFDRTIESRNRFINQVPRFSYDDVDQGFTINRSNASRRFEESNYLNLTSYLDYNTTIRARHEISVTAGASHEQNESGFFSAWRNDFTQTELFTLNLGDAGEQFNNEAGSDWAIKSFFARGTYIYNSKYIAEINFRRDGTSVFSPGKRWGNFTGYSLAWRASDEDFINNWNLFDNLKVRFSQGVTGNQDLNSGNLYDYIALIDFEGAYPFGDGVQSQNARERSIVSQNRTWEDLQTTNIGLDFAFLDSRLSGFFDWFIKKNENMLLPVNLPSVLGGSAPAQNIGSLETKGFELSLTWADQTSSGLSYSVTGILSDNHNKLVDLDGRDQVSLGLNEQREGYPLNTYFGYVFDGFIQTEEERDAYRQLKGVPPNLEIGDTKYKDLNGDGEISLVDADGNDADIVTYGNNAPRYSYALNASVAYKGFDFSLFLQGVAERTLYYTDQWRLPFEQPWWQPLRRFYRNTWSPENPDAEYPRLTTGPQRYWNYNTSEMNRINGAYLRVKNITLGYTLPQSLLEDIGIDKVRVFFSGEDLLTIDKLDGGYDAENTNGAANFYPFTKRYSFGLSIDF